MRRGGTFSNDATDKGFTAFQLDRNLPTVLAPELSLSDRADIVNYRSKLGTFIFYFLLAEPVELVIVFFFFI